MHTPVQRTTHAHVAALSTQAGTGDKKAQESLLAQLYPLLSAVVHRYPHVFPTREDALQEGRLVVLEALYSFNPSVGVPFLAYARQKLLYHFLNSARVQPPLPLLDGTATASEEAGESWASQLPDPDPLPEEAVLHQELDRWLQNALAQLSDEHKKLFQAHFGEKKTLRCIAEETNQHPVTLSRKKAALLTLLREKLETGQ